ncbi:hypothetical protein OPT61_g4256 [Boeremia exigua]|uniref:Uncharacterized protein n=1 Tax=Boeremia exigua TaxID=749465 RepID=A0ACC2IEN2_9PLEO|nr:hypothetical protein OPT61_g4256 [Boeremia exigua]
MVRITVWRVISTAIAGSCFLSIILPVIWLTLPTPSISDKERATYVQDTLAAGRPLIAALDVGPFRRSDPRALDEDWCSDCTSALLHWQFVRHNDEINIQLAPHMPHPYGALDMPFGYTDHLRPAKIWNERSAGDSDTWAPYFTEFWGPPNWPVIVPAGRADEHISQGWFHEVDRHLIEYNFLKRTTDIDIRVAIPEPGVVEFWRGAAVDRTFDNISNGWADRLNKHRIFKDQTRTPGIYKHMRQDKRDNDLVASFEIPEGAHIKDIVVRELKGDLPSRTWPFRQKLIYLFPSYIVGPILLFGDMKGLLGPHSTGILVTLIAILGIYSGTICYFWICAGCPRNFLWASRFWQTRYLIPPSWRGVPDPEHVSVHQAQSAQGAGKKGLKIGTEHELL